MSDPFHLPRRALSVLNGAIGGRLDAAGVGLPTTAHAYPGGPPWAHAAIAATVHGQGHRELCVMVHGLMGDDRAWRAAEHDLGLGLARARGVLPVYVRYNSGLDLRSCARRVDGWLRGLDAQLDPDVRVNVVAHSLGGLVSLLAMSQQDARWRDRVARVVLLGVPHRGAPLARAAAWTEQSLNAREQGWARLLSEVWLLRAESIADLAQGLDQVDVRLPHGSRTFVAAGVLASPPNVQPDRTARTTQSAALAGLTETLGDALVDLDSATRTFGDAHVEVFGHTGHQRLMHAPQVEAAVVRWWSDDRSAVST